MSERRLEAVVIGPGKPGLLRVALGHGERRFVVDAQSELLQPHLRLPNSEFVAVVEGRELVRVESAGRIWLTIQDQIRSVLNADWDPLGVSDIDDEQYDIYIGRLYSLLASDVSEQAIAAHLLSIELERMELVGTPMDKLLKVATKLRELQLPPLDGPSSPDKNEATAS
jgi:hypothetical protein